MITIAKVGAYLWWRNAFKLANLRIGPIQVTNEPWVHRIISHNVSGRDSSFRDGIRARDGKCVVIGVVNRMAPYN